MLRNIDASFGLVFSQPVLLALGRGGEVARRRVPHRAAERDAGVAGGAEPFREILGEDPDVTDVLDAARLDACFDLKRALSNTGRVFDVLDTVESSEL